MNLYILGERTTPSLLRQLTGFSVPTIICKAKKNDRFNLGKYEINTRKSGGNCIYTLTSDTKTITGGISYVSEKSGHSQNGIYTSFKDGRKIGSFIVTRTKNTPVKCLWDGNKMYTDLTLEEAREISNSTFSFSTESGNVKEFIYDKERILGSEDLKFYCKTWGQDDNRYYFGTTKGIIKDMGFTANSPKILKELYASRTFSEQNKKLYRGVQ